MLTRPARLRCWSTASRWRTRARRRWRHRWRPWRRHSWRHCHDTRAACSAPCSAESSPTVTMRSSISCGSRTSCQGWSFICWVLVWLELRFALFVRIKTNLRLKALKIQSSQIALIFNVKSEQINLYIFVAQLHGFKGWRAVDCIYK